MTGDLTSPREGEGTDMDTKPSSHMDKTASRSSVAYTDTSASSGSLATSFVSADFEPDDDIVLRAEWIPPRAFKQLIIGVKACVLLATALLAILLWLIIQKGPEYSALSRTIPLINVSVAGTVLVPLISADFYFGWRVVRSTRSGRKWSHRRRRASTLTGLQLVVQTVSAACFLTSNVAVVGYGPGSTRGSGLIATMGAMQWFALMAQLAIGWVFVEGILPITCSRWRSMNAGRADAMVMDLGWSSQWAKGVTWLAACALSAAYAGVAGRSALPGAADASCRSPTRTIVLGAVQVVMVALFVLATFRASWHGRRYLWAQPYAPYRRSNVMLRLHTRIRGEAWPGSVAVVAALAAAGQGHCASDRITLLGYAPLQVIFAAVAIAFSELTVPARPPPDAVLSAWLQAFAWTEAALPTARADRLDALPKSARSIAVKISESGKVTGDSSASHDAGAPHGPCAEIAAAEAAAAAAGPEVDSEAGLAVHPREPRVTKGTTVGRTARGRVRSNRWVGEPAPAAVLGRPGASSAAASRKGAAERSVPRGNAAELGDEAAEPPASGEDEEDGSDGDAAVTKNGGGRAAAEREERHEGKHAHSHGAKKKGPPSKHTLCSVVARALDAEPVWCFETAAKLLYWCFLVYAQDAEVAAAGYDADTALAMYDLHSFEALRERTRGARVTLGWGDDCAVVAFRGTATLADFLDDARVWRLPWPVTEDELGSESCSYFESLRIFLRWVTGLVVPRPRVHAGFLKSYRASGLRDRLLERVEEILDGMVTAQDARERGANEAAAAAAAGAVGSGPATEGEGGAGGAEGAAASAAEVAGEARVDEGRAPTPPPSSSGSDRTPQALRVFVTGHSLGGALATLAALDVAELLQRRGLTGRVSLEVHTFGAPRTGNRAFCRVYKRAVPATWHVINAADTVTRSGKLYGLYKRAGKRVLVNPRGDLVVRPTYLEQFALRTPGVGSVRDHYLTSYRASFVAVLAAQFGRKQLLGGRDAALALLRGSEAASLFTHAGLDDAAINMLLQSAVDDVEAMGNVEAVTCIVHDARETLSGFGRYVTHQAQTAARLARRTLGAGGAADQSVAGLPAAPAHIGASGTSYVSLPRGGVPSALPGTLAGVASPFASAAAEDVEPGMEPREPPDVDDAEDVRRWEEALRDAAAREGGTDEVVEGTAVRLSDLMGRIPSEVAARRPSRISNRLSSRISGEIESRIAEAGERARGAAAAASAATPAGPPRGPEASLDSHLMLLRRPPKATGVHDIVERSNLSGLPCRYGTSPVVPDAGPWARWHRDRLLGRVSVGAAGASGAPGPAHAGVGRAGSPASLSASGGMPGSLGASAGVATSEAAQARATAAQADEATAATLAPEGSFLSSPRGVAIHGDAASHEGASGGPPSLQARPARGTSPRPGSASSRPASEARPLPGAVPRNAQAWDEDGLSCLRASRCRIQMAREGKGKSALGATFERCAQRGAAQRSAARAEARARAEEAVAGLGRVDENGSDERPPAVRHAGGKGSGRRDSPAP